eukprot:1271915-Prymnesium_polylepis.1
MPPPSGSKGRGRRRRRRLLGAACCAACGNRGRGRRSPPQTPIASWPRWTRQHPCSQRYTAESTVSSLSSLGRSHRIYFDPKTWIPPALDRADCVSEMFRSETQNDRHSPNKRTALSSPTWRSQTRSQTTNAAECAKPHPCHISSNLCSETIP